MKMNFIVLIFKYFHSIIFTCLSVFVCLQCKGSSLKKTQVFTPPQPNKTTLTQSIPHTQSVPAYRFQQILQTGSTIP